MKVSVNLKLDADLLRKARAIADEEGRSLSTLLSDQLVGMIRDRKAFDRARRRRSLGCVKVSTSNGRSRYRETFFMSGE